MVQTLASDIKDFFTLLLHLIGNHRKQYYDLFKFNTGAVYIARLVKCLPCKHENMCQIAKSRKRMT